MYSSTSNAGKAYSNYVGTGTVRTLQYVQGGPQWHEQSK